MIGCADQYLYKRDIVFQLKSRNTPFGSHRFDPALSGYRRLMAKQRIDVSYDSIGFTPISNLSDGAMRFSGAKRRRQSSVVLRQVLRQTNQLNTVELRGNLREFCVIESCVVMHFGAD